MKLSMILLPLFFVTGISGAQIFEARMDSLFSSIEKNKKGMGSISIFSNGNEVYQNAFGFADFTTGRKATKKTKYRIGSISKTFTATIIMQLIEEKKLHLRQQLAVFFPGLPNAMEIRIEHLLRHRSGLFNFTNADDYTEWMEHPQSKAMLLQKFMDNGIVFEANAKAEYSNTNYVLLSYIAEEIEEKPFSEILMERIVKPCDLSSTYYGGEINPGNDEALSYLESRSWQPATETAMSVPSGAGAIVSTPTDLNTFFCNLFAGKLVSENSLSKMKVMVDGYGMGMFQIPFYDKQGYGHTGGIDGFQSMAIFFPQDNLSIAYTSNGTAMPVNDIIIGALSIYFGKEYSLPDFSPAMVLKSKDLDQYLGVYSSSGFPLKITISKDGDTLIGQATGQPSFPLEVYGKNKFKFDQAGLKIDFKPAENIMILKQGGGVFELKRE